METSITTSSPSNENKKLSDDESVKIVESKDRGRYVVSNDAKKANQVIFSVQHPHCYGFEPYLIKQLCVVCFTYLETRKQLQNNKQKQYIPCSGCDQVYFCSERCFQRGHYSKREKDNDIYINLSSNNNSNHITFDSAAASADQHYHTVLECLVLSALQPPAGLSFHHITEIRMIINYISLTPYMRVNNNNNSNNNKSVNSNESSEISTNLNINTTIIKDRMSMLVGDFNGFTNKVDIKLLKRMSHIIKKAFSYALYEVNESDILELISKSTRNCFGIWKNYDECFGLAMYLEASLFNHSCYPNAARVQRGSAIDIIAIRDIEPGEEITIAYINIRQTTAERRTHLKENYLFECQCLRCTKSTPEIEATIQSYTCRNPRVQCYGYLYVPLSNNNNNNNINNNNEIIRECNFCHWKESQEIKVD